MLLAFAFAVDSSAHAGEKGGQLTIDGVLSGKDSVNIPDGPGYDFKIDAEYKLVSVQEIPQNGTTIRNYSLKAKVPAASPALSYLGKSLLLLSDRLEPLCREVGMKKAQWKHVDLSSLKHSAGQDLNQYVEFGFSCFDRL